MKMNRNNGLALFLIVCGALIVMSKLGHGLGIGGHLMGLIIPAAMLGFGYLGVRHGKGLIGWVLLALGGILLLGKLSGLIGIVIAVGLIGYGVAMLRRNNAH